MKDELEVQNKLKQIAEDQRKKFNEPFYSSYIHAS